MHKTIHRLSLLAASVAVAAHDRLFSYMQRSGLVANLVVDNAFETKGTHVYFAMPGAPATVVKLTCPTGVTGVGGGSKDKIDTTCLDETGAYRKYIGGFADAAEVSVPFILYKADGSQADLFTLRDSNEVVSWFVGLSNVATAPTLDSDSLLVPPTARDGFSFEGYVSNLTIDMATNEVVRGTLTVQPTGTTTYHQGT